MKIFILALTLGLLFSNNIFATECGIKLGGGGKNSSVIKLENNKTTRVNDIGGPWSFIRYTYGPCNFELYNEHNFKGRRKANYGSGIGNPNSRSYSDSLRVGAIGGKNKNGWRVRSLIITPGKRHQCSIKLSQLNESGVIFRRKQIFHGPSRLRNVSGWSAATPLSRNCQATLYSGFNFSGKSAIIKQSFGRDGVVNQSFREGWRIRSIEIKEINAPIISRRGEPKFHDIKHIKGRCLDISGGINQNQTNVQIYQCNNSKSQKWRWTKTGQIKNIMGRCLDISGTDITNNSNIEIYQCGSGRTQKWEKISNNRIRNSTGFCLDIVNGVNANKTNVQLYRCKNTTAQQWK